MYDTLEIIKIVYWLQPLIEWFCVEKKKKNS